MGAGHDHHHDHGHDHGAPAGNDRAFAIGVALNVALVLAQVAGGLWANSLALLADAGHNLSDVLALLLAWGAGRLALRAPSARRTYGLRKSSILASLANAVLLLIAIGAIGWEAVQRLGAPPPVLAGPVAWIAAGGIVVNGATALLFMSGRKGDINIRGAFLHMVADAAVSAGVVVAALLILATGWAWIDPAVSLAVSGVIAWGSWSLLRESLDLAMDAVPDGVDEAAVLAWLEGQPGVSEVHDLHIWAMSTTETALTVHLVRPVGGLDNPWLGELCAGLRMRFAIGHATIQVEAVEPVYACALAPDHVV